MNFESTKEQMALREAARRCTDASNESVRDALRSMGAAGILGAALRGPSMRSETVSYAMSVVEIAAARPSWALAVAAHAEFCQALVSGSRGAAGEPPWEAFIRGEKLGCVGYIRLSAEHIGEKAVLRGKTCAPNVGNADHLVVFAETDANLSAFLLDTDNAAIHVEAPSAAAIAGSIRNVLVEDAVIDETRRLDAIPPAELLESLRDLRRISIASAALGIAKASAEQSIAYVKDRDRGAGPTSDSQAVHFLLSDMATEIDAATLSVFQAAARRDAGKSHRIEASSAKLLATATALRATHAAARIRGVRDYTTMQEDNEAAALALDILDATSEEELSHIATVMLEEP